MRMSEKCRNNNNNNSDNPLTSRRNDGGKNKETLFVRLGIVAAEWRRVSRTSNNKQSCSCQSEENLF